MRTAVIGTGIMGAGMARSLAREGHDVVVWNRTAEKAEALVGDGISAAASVAEAVSGVDVVLTMLFDTDAVLAVTEDVARASGDAVWVQTATVGPDGARRIAEAAGDAADRMLDAPVLGTRKPAEDGALVVLASGPAALVERAQPVLDAIGSRTVRAGERLGDASALKLACNSWVGLITAGTAQALALAQAQGVDPQLFLDAIDGGAVDTPYAHVKGAPMISGDYSAVSFALDGVRKDLGLMVSAAEAGGMSADLLRTVLGLYDRASESGHGDEDMAAVRTAFDG
ncbi:3-hydroxyisobutyrate dehydrogenase [Marmoricola endophyticus]|uniref:3-hydroxyisobutyrate dehydrogenase n=1 Tax=Marmoricola endophyticus TaxID=2040280 RepID=A0A917BBG1_9ACTN|nr:NAD(P)-dependent oxidoreductase [Marmoricola endophyticus]GGF34081.1 3-hydroxyisobutyrate dehydrogenase [Marmoricola endophyticus]